MIGASLRAMTSSVMGSVERAGSACRQFRSARQAGCSYRASFLRQRQQHAVQLLDHVVRRDQVHHARAARSWSSTADRPRTCRAGGGRRRSYLSTHHWRLRYGPLRAGLVAAYKPTTGVPTAVAMCAGPESGVTSSDGRASSVARNSQQRVLADGVLAGLLHAAHDCFAHAPLDLAAAAAQHDAQAERRDRVVGDLRVVLGPPVAQPMAGAGTDDERLRVVGNHALRIVARGLRNRNVPAQQLLVDMELLGEAEQRVHARAAARRAGCDWSVNSHCSSRARWRSKPSLIFAGTSGREQAGAQRDLHVHENVEVPAAHRLAQHAVRACQRAASCRGR